MFVTKLLETIKAKLPWNGLKRNIGEGNKHRFQEIFIRKFLIVFIPP